MINLVCVLSWFPPWALFLPHGITTGALSCCLFLIVVFQFLLNYSTWLLPYPPVDPVLSPRLARHSALRLPIKSQHRRYYFSYTIHLYPALPSFPSCCLLPSFSAADLHFLPSLAAPCQIQIVITKRRPEGYEEGWRLVHHSRTLMFEATPRMLIVVICPFPMRWRGPICFSPTATDIDSSAQVFIVSICSQLLQLVQLLLIL